MCVRPIRLRQEREIGVTVPCGFCVECRARYARSWAVRCVHEASLHEENCFGTLTYEDRFLPPHGSLDRAAFALFMKRLRKAIAPRRIKFYHVGEYGDRSGRPHYHFLIFGWMPRDGVALPVGSGYALWRSPQLESLWKFGLSSFGAVSFESAAYVSRYVMKKVDQVGKKRKYGLDPATGEMVEIEPEYSTMSRGGRGGRGLGYEWFSRFGEEVERLGTVRAGAGEALPPRYYDELIRERDAAAYEVLKLRRMRKSKHFVTTRERMAREVIALDRLTLATRRLSI